MQVLKGWAVLIVFFLSPPLFSYADESWFCTEASSRKIGTEVHACGAGVSTDESEARLRALDNAKEEFRRLCEASDDCKGRHANAEPRRTTCEQTQGQFRCRRLVVFTVSAESGTPGTPATRTAAATQQPKIDKGMSKSEVLSLFGDPAHVDEINDNWLTLQYEDPAFCETTPCTVTLERALVGFRVHHYSGFFSRNTHALEEKSLWDQLKFW